MKTEQLKENKALREEVERLKEKIVGLEPLIGEEMKTFTLCITKHWYDNGSCIEEAYIDIKASCRSVVEDIGYAITSCLPNDDSKVLYDATVEQKEGE